MENLTGELVQVVGSEIGKEELGFHSGGWVLAQVRTLSCTSRSSGFISFGEKNTGSKSEKVSLHR